MKNIDIEKWLYYVHLPRRWQQFCTSIFFALAKKWFHELRASYRIYEESRRVAIGYFYAKIARHLISVSIEKKKKKSPLTIYAFLDVPEWFIRK